MASFFIGILTLALLLVSLFLILVILIQRPSANSGLGTAMGGGLAESTFGARTTEVLTRFTVYALALFFGLSFVLYLTYIARLKPEKHLGRDLPRFSAQEQPDPTNLSPGVDALTEAPVANQLPLPEQAGSSE